jgi:hypothetical protein
LAAAQRFFLSLPPYCSEEEEDAVIAFTDKPTTNLTSVADPHQSGSPGRSTPAKGPLACLVSSREAQLATAQPSTKAVFSSTELVAADFLLNIVAYCSISFVFGKNCPNFD